MKKIKSLIFLLSLSLPLVAQEIKIAIFYQLGFPYYIVSWSLKPTTLAQFMRDAGLEVDLLGVKDLSNPEKFNFQKYAILIHIYGNTFPLQAVDRKSVV